MDLEREENFEPLRVFMKYLRPKEVGILTQRDLRENAIEYLEGAIQEIAREHPEYFGENTKIEETTRKIASKIAEKLERDGKL